MYAFTQRQTNAEVLRLYRGTHRPAEYETGGEEEYLVIDGLYRTNGKNNA